MPVAPPGVIRLRGGHGDRQAREYHPCRPGQPDGIAPGWWTTQPNPPALHHAVRCSRPRVGEHQGVVPVCLQPTHELRNRSPPRLGCIRVHAWSSPVRKTGQPKRNSVLYRDRSRARLGAVRAAEEPFDVPEKTARWKHARAHTLSRPAREAVRPARAPGGMGGCVRKRVSLFPKGSYRLEGQGVMSGNNCWKLVSMFPLENEGCFHPCFHFCFHSSFHHSTSLRMRFTYCRDTPQRSATSFVDSPGSDLRSASTAARLLSSCGSSSGGSVVA